MLKSARLNQSGEANINSKLSAEAREDILKNRKISSAVMADIHGVHVSTVRRLRKGSTYKHRPVDPVYQDVVDWYSVGGWTYKEIGNAFDISPAAVWRAVLRADRNDSKSLEKNREILAYRQAYWLINSKGKLWCTFNPIEGVISPKDVQKPATILISQERLGEVRLRGIRGLADYGDKVGYFYIPWEAVIEISSNAPKRQDYSRRPRASR